MLSRLLSIFVSTDVNSRAKFNVSSIDYFGVVSLVAWPLNESEAGGDLNMIETSLL